MAVNAESIFFGANAVPKHYAISMMVIGLPGLVCIQDVHALL